MEMTMTAGYSPPAAHVMQGSRTWLAAQSALSTAAHAAQGSRIKQN